MAKTMDWFECEDGYPVGASLERLRKHEFDHDGAADFLVNQLPEIIEGISCCVVRVEDSKEALYGPGEIKLIESDMKLIEFHTGGWGGAEDLINAILGRFWINYFHTKWERGGHFHFEVPVKLLEQTRG